MVRTKHAYTKQLIALLLIAVMVFVHVVKLLHTHASSSYTGLVKHEHIIDKAAAVHSSCSICEFQLAKDVPFTGTIQLVIAPVYTAPTYSRLLTSINSDRLFTNEGRGPPHA